MMRRMLVRPVSVLVTLGLLLQPFVHLIPVTRPTPVYAQANADAKFHLPLVNGAMSSWGVHSLTGVYAHVGVDLAVRGRGPVPVFMRTYYSDGLQTGTLGPGWSHVYAMKIDPAPNNPANTTLTVIGPQGRADTYTRSGSTITPPPGIRSLLVDNGNGTFSVVHPDQSEWIFEGSGRLSLVRDRHQNASWMTYDAGGKLTAVSDPTGRGSMTLEYDGSGRLWKVKDWASPQTVVTYTYDTSGRLWKVTDVMGGEVEYGYDANNRMLTVARLITAGQPKVTLVTNVYNANGRVTQQTDAEGRVTTYRQYENGPLWETLYPLGSSKPGGRLLVRDSYDANNRLSNQYREYDRLIQEGGDQVEEETLSWTYNADSFPVTFDRAGKLWRLCYDVDYAGAAIGGSRGNLTRLIAPSPSSGAARPTSLYTYDTKNNPTKLVPPKGVASTANDTCTTNLSGTTGTPPMPIVNNDYATDLVYDGSQKKLLSITKRFHDPPPSGPLKTATWKYEYTNASFPELVTRVTPPNGNTGANPDTTYSTDFEYYGPGSGTDTGLLWIVRDPYDKEVKYTCDAVG